MPRYYFHIMSPGTCLPDEVGVELPDVDHVRTEAQQGARDIMAEDLRAGRTVDHQAFEVRDQAGELVFALTFRDMLFLAVP